MLWCVCFFVVIGSGSLTMQQRWSEAHNHLLLASQSIEHGAMTAQSKPYSMLTRHIDI